MTDLLRGLGTTYGRNSLATTFTDQGPISPGSPLRRAYAFWQPTLLGLLAGSGRLLRNPYVVYSLGQSLGERTLIEHLLDLYRVNLAAVFGDNATIGQLQDLLPRAHRRRFPSSNQPPWFAVAVGERRDFTANEYELRCSVAATLTGAVARAHLLTGVLIDGQQGTDYCKDAGRTLGRASDVALPISTLDALQRYEASNAGVPLMDALLLTQAGVPQLLEGVLNAELAPGVTVAAFADKFVGLMHPEDREALGLNWTDADQEALTEWAREYTERVSRFVARTGVNPSHIQSVAPSADDDEITADDFFIVSSGRVLYG